MKHPNPYADFFLANTHAWEVDPGHEAARPIRRH